MMNPNDLLPVPSAVPPITDRESLKEAILAWAEAHAQPMPSPAVTLNRLFNRSASRYGITVSEVLIELHKEGKLTVFEYKPTRANWVFSASPALIAVLKDEVTDSGKTPLDMGKLSLLFERRLQIMASVEGK